MHSFSPETIIQSLKTKVLDLERQLKTTDVPRCLICMVRYCFLIFVNCFYVQLFSVSGWIFLLVPAHPGSPGQRAVKRVCMLQLFSALTRLGSKTSRDNLQHDNCHENVYKIKW